MDKLKQESVDLTEQNIDKIGAMFPNVITETKDENGNLKKAINFTLLKQMLSKEVVDGDECYEFTWVGKKQSIIEGNTPIRKTLRPCKEESKDWDKTENLYIEGDNLEVLKLLQGSYLNAIKMIYIDPPYNTGNDFVYRDNFAMSKEDYDEESGLFDEDENRLFKNPKTNGCYHSDWCSMMYPRLQLARNLLTEDGVVFISIDENEVTALKQICDEIFGEDNALLPFIWDLPRGINAGYISKAHEYILVYAKNITSLGLFRKEKPEISIERCNKKIDARHPRSTINFPAGIEYEGEDKTITNVIEGSEAIYIDSEMIFKNGKLSMPVRLDAGWTMKGMILDWLKGNQVYDLKGQRINRFFFKENGRLYSEKIIEFDSPKSILRGLGDSQQARKELDKLFNSEDYFDYPKPITLIKQLINYVTDKDSIVLDFFSGSATSAHSIIKLNAEDGGTRKFIMVQLPEETNTKSEAYKGGYKNICEIGKERIRRAGVIIQEELESKKKAKGLFERDPSTKKLDTGFRVLKLDTTNMKDVYYSAYEYSQQMLLDLESNIKEDRTDLDLLFGVLVDWGVPLSLPLETKSIEGKKVHFVNDTDLVACFEESISESLIREVAKVKPMRVVFRDSSFANSPDKINVTEIFKTISPDTTIKVI